MTYYLWILLFGALVVIKAQELSLEDALDFGDDKATAKTEKPPKAKGSGLDLEDALGPEPEKPKTDPKLPVDTGNSGGSFSDSDLGDVAKDGGNPGASQWDSSDEPQNDQPKAAEGGQMAGIISAVAVAVFGAASSYFAYQKKKLCFKVQGGADPESGRNQSGTQSDPQAFRNLLRTS